MTPLRRPRVLVVSRDPAGELLTNLLTVLDCEVEQATVAGAALQGGYDLLALDLRLAGSDAWTVTKTIRRFGFRGPVLVLTTSPPTLVERDRAERAGAALLQVPVDLDILAHMLPDLFPEGLPARGEQSTLVPTSSGSRTRRPRQ